jgi:hypothetical protein
MRSAFVQSRAAVVSLTASFGKKPGVIFISLLLFYSAIAQIDTTHLHSNTNFSAEAKPGGSFNDMTSQSQNLLSKWQKRKRQLLIGGINVIGYGGSLIILSNTWYKNYPHTSFHIFNDNKEWLQAPVIMIDSKGKFKAYALYF